MSPDFNATQELVIVSVSMTIAQRNGLRELAQASGQSVSAILRGLIDPYLTRALLNAN